MQFVHRPWSYIGNVVFDQGAPVMASDSGLHVPGNAVSRMLPAGLTDSAKDVSGQPVLHGKRLHDAAEPHHDSAEKPRHDSAEKPRHDSAEKPRHAEKRSHDSAESPHHDSAEKPRLDASHDSKPVPAPGISEDGSERPPKARKTDPPKENQLDKPEVMDLQTPTKGLPHKAHSFDSGWRVDDLMTPQGEDRNAKDYESAPSHGTASLIGLGGLGMKRSRTDGSISGSSTASLKFDKFYYKYPERTMIMPSSLKDYSPEVDPNRGCAVTSSPATVSARLRKRP